jgi:uncharacterized protein (TIGR02284 family)
MDNNEIVKALNSLARTLKDGEAGYREAADEASNGEFVALFNRLAKQRSQFHAELAQEMRTLGDEIDDSGSMLAAFHRTWINVRDAITGKDDDSVIAEVERGEQQAVENYSDALALELPANIASTVRSQYESIRMSLGEIQTLRKVST